MKNASAVGEKEWVSKGVQATEEPQKCITAIGPVNSAVAAMQIFFQTQSSCIRNSLTMDLSSSTPPRQGPAERF
jgi:hypothetical protein